MQRRIVELEFFKRVAQGIVLIRFGGVQTGKNLWLYFFETWQSLLCRSQIVGQLFFQCDRIAHLGCLQLFDARNDVAHLTRFKAVAGLIGWGKYTHGVCVIHSLGGHHFEALAFTQAAIHHTHQHNHAHIGIKPTVDNHGAQWRVGVAFGCWNFGHDGFQNFIDAHAGFGGTGNGLAGVNTDDVLYFGFGVFWISLRQIHLI